MSTENVAKQMFGVFNKKASEVKSKKEEKSGGNYFNPDVKTAPNQIWRGIIKFLPKMYDFENENKTETIETVSFSVPNGSTKQRYLSPKSLDKYGECKISDRIWEMRNSDDVAIKDAVNGSYNKSTYSLIQIINDTQNPENNGKIMIWNTPSDILKLIDSQMYPAQADIDLGAVDNNIYDPINGFCLNLKVTLNKTTINGKEREFREYGESKFADKFATHMIVSGETTQRKPLPADGSDEMNQLMQLMIDTIIAHTDSFKALEFKEFNQSEFDKMNAVLDTICGVKTSSQPVAEPVKEVEQPVAEPTKEVSTESNDADLFQDDEDDVIAQMKRDGAI